MVAIFFGGEELDAEADFHLLGNNVNELGKYKTAGDINGDGFDDLIISRNIEPELNSPIKFEIYLGGPNMDMVMDFELEDIFFYESPINCMGDFNGDSLDDIIISTVFIPNNYSSTLIYFGNTIGNHTPNIVTDSLYAIQGCLYFCNINQDIYDDIAILTYENNSNQIDIYYGNNEEEFIRDISIPFTLQNYYYISCNIGDFNGDNEDEILINAGESDNTATLFGLLGGSSVDEEITITNFKLSNYPNPFNPVTTICYDLPVNVANPVIEIFNIKGERIRELKIENVKCKINFIAWNGKDNYHNQVSSGVYLYRIKTDDRVSMSKKMLLLR